MAFSYERGTHAFHFTERRVTRRLRRAMLNHKPDYWVDRVIKFDSEKTSRQLYRGTLMFHERDVANRVVEMLFPKRARN